MAAVSLALPVVLLALLAGAHAQYVMSSPPPPCASPPPPVIYTSPPPVARNPPPNIYQTPPPVQPQCTTAWAAISADARLTALALAIQTNGLVDTLNTPGLPITIFAPTNYAVTTSTAGALSVNTLLYHIIDSAGVSALGLVARGNPSVWTMANTLSTTVARDYAGITTISSYTNRALIVQADIPFCSGYIHIIDAVLNPALPASPSPPPRAASPSPPPTPPAPPACAVTAYQAISSIPALAPFKMLIDRTNNAAVFQDPFFSGTIFAPLDCYFSPVPGATLAQDTATLFTHVVPNSVLFYTGDLVTGNTWNAQSGKTLAVAYDGTAASPNNLRLVMEGYTSFFNPGTVNVRNCGYILHTVGTTFWNNRPPLSGK